MLGSAAKGEPDLGVDDVIGFLLFVVFLDMLGFLAGVWDNTQDDTALAKRFFIGLGVRF